MQPNVHLGTIFSKPEGLQSISVGTDEDADAYLKYRDHLGQVFDVYLDSDMAYRVGDLLIRAARHARGPQIEEN